MFVGEYKDQTVVALPYAGDRFTMYLVLPHNVRYSPLYNSLRFFVETVQRKYCEKGVSIRQTNNISYDWYAIIVLEYPGKKFENWSSVFIFVVENANCIVWIIKRRLTNQNDTLKCISLNLIHVRCMTYFPFIIFNCNGI